MRLIFFPLIIATLLASGCDSSDTKQQELPRLPDQAVPDSSKSASEARGNLWKNHGCELITDAEMTEIFGIDPARDVLNTRSLPDQAFCLRKWKKTDWKERETNNEKEGRSWLDPENSLILQVFGYANNDHGKQQISMLRRDRRNTYEEDVTGLGDDALWSTSTVTLLVRKGHLVVSIALNASDQPHDNLAKAKEVAEIALRKM
jgi:hypothetical protein